MESLGKEQEQIFKALQTLLLYLDQMTANVASLPVLHPASPVIPPPDAVLTALPVPRLCLPTPAKFSGDHEACWGFINQCSIQFELSPSSFPTHRSKVTYVISLLSDQALAWASPLWEWQDPLTHNYSAFIEAFRKTFDEPGTVSSAAPLSPTALARHLYSPTVCHIHPYFGVRTQLEPKSSYRYLLARPGGSGEK